MDAALAKEMYQRYGYAVHRRCLRLLRESAAADDALHDVFIKVLRYRSAAPVEHPLAWLYTIADRCCFDALKKGRRLTLVDRTEQLECGESNGQSSTPAADRVHLVAQLLARCSDRIRRVAVLYYIDGMTQQEVAEAVGCSRKTVKKRLAAFRDKAAANLGESRVEELNHESH